MRWATSGHRASIHVRDDDDDGQCHVQSVRDGGDHRVHAHDLRDRDRSLCK